MPATLIEYEIIRAGPNLDEIKAALTALGRKGFELRHTSIDAEGTYTFVMSKDTGRNPEGDEQPAGGEWIDDGFVNEETSWA